MTRVIGLAIAGTVAAIAVVLAFADGDETASARSRAETTRAEFASGGRTFARRGISAADTAPVAKRARQKMPSIRQYVARHAPVRRAGRYAGTTWYFARGKRRRLNLCIIQRDDATAAACPLVPRHYRGGWWFYGPGPRGLQISTVVVPDGFTRVRIADGRAARISSITNNLLWVVHRDRVKLVLKGPNRRRLRQKLFYYLPRQ